MLFANREKLLRGLRRDNIVVAMEIDCRPAFAQVCEQAGGIVSGLAFQAGRLESLAVEIELTDACLK